MEGSVTSARPFIHIYIQIHKRAPTFGGSDVTPGEGKGFKMWDDNGLSEITDLFQSNILILLRDLRRKYDTQLKMTVLLSGWQVRICMCVHVLPLSGGGGGSVGQQRRHRTTQTASIVLLFIAFFSLQSSARPP